MWLLKQPRDYLTTFLFVGMIVAAVVGVLFYNPTISLPAFTGFTSETGSYMFPTLFITIACGAVSGFHSLVSSETSSKQIKNEKDMLQVGYGSMLLESLLAILVVVVVGSLTQLVSDGVLTDQLASLVTAEGATPFTKLSFQELFEVENSQEASGLNKILTNKYFATLITLFFGYLLSLGGYNNIWPLFGSANQLLAAMVLISLSVFLKVTGRKGFMLYIPMCTMLVVTLSSLGLSVYNIVNAWMTTGTFDFLTSGLQLIFAILLIALGVLVAFFDFRKLFKTKKV